MQLFGASFQVIGISIANQGPVVGCFEVPPSKPETQRALAMAALADGTSTIRSPLHSSETLRMMEACREIGAEIIHDGAEIRVVGTGIGERVSPTSTRPNTRYVWADGSALIGRLFATICSLIPERVVIDGNNVLRNRPFAPLFSALRAKGAEFGFF